MGTQPTVADDEGLVRDLLLEDYRYRADALRGSEQLGESRVTHFMAVAALLLGGVATLATQEHGPKGNTLKVIVIGVELSLLVVGVMSLFRLMIRNDRTDECKRDLDHIRQTIKDRFDKRGLLVDYHPVGNQAYRAEKDGKLQHFVDFAGRRFGGLAHMMAAINSLLLAAFVISVALPFEQPLSFKAPIVWLACGLAVAVFPFSLALQIWGMARRKKACRS